MFLKYIFVCIFHFLGIAFVLNTLNLVLPCCVSSYYFRVANFILCAVLAKLTLGYSKKFFFNETLPADGKAVLITGSARGIGNALVKHLDSKGYHVFASCLNPNSAGAADLRNSCSSRVKILQLDVTKDDSVQKALEYVKENLGVSELWAVINNAGIQKGFSTELSSIQDFRDTLESNVLGQIRVTKAFLPLLRKSRGRVINMSSLAGHITIPYISAYTISKFASVAFSEGLRFEMDAWGVKVISIEPEFFETDLTTGKHVTMRVNEAFDSVAEDIRKDYGEEYIEKFKTIVAKAYPPSPNMYKVINAIDCAVSLKTPDAAYIVYRHLGGKLFFNFYDLLPTECKLFAIKTITFFLGLPVPKKSK